VAILVCLVLVKDSAAQPCSDVQKSVASSVVVAAPPSAGPLILAVANQLQYGGDPSPMTVIWQLSSSCGAVQALTSDTGGTCTPPACITGQAQFLASDGTLMNPDLKTCSLDAAGTHVDLALSDVFPGTCPGLGGNTPAGILDTPGPISAYALVMAPQGSDTAIQAEEAHFVFTLGKAAFVKPWLNDSTIFLFGTADAGQLILGTRIKVDVTSWKGMTVASPTDLISGLATDPPTAIGILPTTIADPQRTALSILAFQSIGQHGAYFPDRKSSTFDKQNVRDGHYPLWGYLHMLLKTQLGQPIPTPISQNGLRLSNILLANTTVGNNQDVLPMQVAAGLIPQCAMRVSRTSDSPPLVPSTSPNPCNCWFEKNVTGGVLNCMQCSPTMSCAVGSCLRNLCEVQ
jgi:hypothetical protein